MRLIHGDCLEEMDNLIAEGIKFDLILTDIPYGTTMCKWDDVIPFDKMWSRISKLKKERTPVLLFGNEPFSSFLRVSNVKEYKYDWIWNKENASNFLAARYMPLKPVEYISVFYKMAPTFNPIRRPKTIDYDATRVSVADQTATPTSSDITNASYSRRYYVDDGMRHPINIITFNSQKGECNNSNRVHPTQKPVDLIEYLVKTYTNENDLVLDFTMGSGTTGVVCKMLNRDFVGIELVKDYYDIAVKRIKNVQLKLM